jgi:long-chain fatty acid transport protein
VRDRLTASVIGAALSCGLAATAHAGGFEIPDNGAQSLGRGATFVAKADDGTAIQYNPAGLARQRGTRLYVGGNLYLHSFEFQRSGSFPDDPNDPQTPWGGQPYPLVKNSAGPFFTPFLAASTDFATLDRVTVAVGVFGPSSVGNRTFPLAIQNAPASSRYDYVQSRSSLIYPTASAAVRIMPWLDFGLSAHLVLAKFDQTTVSYADIGQCKNPEYQPCDSRGTLQADATSFSATIGALVRPTANVAIGLSVRTPTSIDATGTLSPEAPKSLPVMVQPGALTLSTRLPLVVRGGVRYIAMDGDFEVYDLELDGTYEGWARAQGDGPRIQIPDLGQFKNIDSLVVHGYSDTFSVRVGGAYNIDALDGIVTVRGGGFYDSAATSFRYTRLDFDTLTKIAGTIGLGYRRGALSFDLGYAAVASIPRVVGQGQGDVRPVNGGKGGRPVDNNGDPTPAVNEGAYRGFTNIFSFGVSVTFDELFGAPRPIHYGNPYERGYVGPGAIEKNDKDKDDKDKDKVDKPADKPADEPKKDLEKPPEKTPDKAADKKPEKKPGSGPGKTPSKKTEWWEDLDN